MELVTTIGIDRVKQLQDDPASIKYDDLKLLMTLKGDKIFNIRRSELNDGEIDDDKSDEKDEHVHKGEVLNIELE